MVCSRTLGTVALMLAAARAACPLSAAVARTGTTALLAVPKAQPNSPRAALFIRGSGTWRKVSEVEARRAAWSPDGRHIALYADGYGSLWVARTDGRHVRQLSPMASAPAWSPDGSALAFVRSGGGIAIADAALWSVRDLRGAVRGYAPSWRPDGGAIAFARSVGGAGSVWTVGVKDGIAERIAVCARPLALAWSSDGRKIAVIEHDPDRMAAPRLSLIETGQPAPSPIGDVLWMNPKRTETAGIAWIGAGRLLVHDGDREWAVVESSGRPRRTPGAANGSDGALLAGVGSDGTICVTLDREGRPTGLQWGAADNPIVLPPIPAGMMATAASWTPVEMPEIAGATGAAQAPIQPTAAIGEPERPTVGGRADQAIVSPMVFPVCGQVSWSDTFGHPRGANRKHAGQDILAPKMRPVVAAFDGIVTLRRPRSPGGHFWLTLVGDNGWTATYLHLNNDTPGTDDGLGTDEHAFAPGLVSGARVQAGQLLGFVGDSGNAEETVPHLHFELAPTATRVPVNPRLSLEAARRLEEPLPAGTEAITRHR